jgi:hypothetical protein
VVKIGVKAAIPNAAVPITLQRLLRPTFSLNGGFCSTPGGRFAGCSRSLVAGLD